ncbi:MAG TPA: chemotaxis protein CheA [Acidisarcina sp.]|nr:chemotaxis protein CheA [Acidisarcina sp.]
MTALREAIEDENRGTESARQQPAPNSFADDAELVGDFLVESREHLAKVEGLMLELEADPSSTEAVHSVFRTFHTIKGLAGFLEFGSIQELAHEVETLLDLARSSRLTITTPVVDAVLESADLLKQELDSIEGRLTGRPSAPIENRFLLEKLQRLARSGASTDLESTQLKVDEAFEAPTHEPEVVIKTEIVEAAPALEEKELEKTQALTHKPAVSPVAAHPEASRSADTFSVRVETAKLDHLMDTVGELVIAQSLIRHNPVFVAQQDPRLLGDIAQLTRITTEVQRAAMEMRMIPIGQLFHRSTRLIRDLSRKTGKQIVLDISGEDTEVDKTIAEELADPLLHMMRNSVDHGIETTEERAATSKNAVATIRLSAYHQGGQIVIEISDDGRGLNREKILLKAQERGLVGDGAQLSDNEVFQLIFQPGFSTAAQVTDTSGRGVGMDVVRQNVQKLRGRIEIHSTYGQGTTFYLKLPLTLAIIEGLVVVVGDRRYIIPIFAVKEMFRPTEDLLSTVHGRDHMAMVRGRLLPIVNLGQRLGIESRITDPCEGLLVVVESEGSQFCLLVDDLIEKQEVVIKGLGDVFRDVTGIAGCAILGDGRVGLILDIDGIVQGRTP